MQDDEYDELFEKWVPKFIEYYGDAFPKDKNLTKTQLINWRIRYLKALESEPQESKTQEKLKKGRSRIFEELSPEKIKEIQVWGAKNFSIVPLEDSPKIEFESSSDIPSNSINLQSGRPRQRWQQGDIIKEVMQPKELLAKVYRESGQILNYLKSNQESLESVFGFLWNRVSKLNAVTENEGGLASLQDHVLELESIKEQISRIKMGTSEKIKKSPKTGSVEKKPQKGVETWSLEETENIKTGSGQFTLLQKRHNVELKPTIILKKLELAMPKVEQGINPAPELQSLLGKQRDFCDLINPASANKLPSIVVCGEFFVKAVQKYREGCMKKHGKQWKPEKLFLEIAEKANSVPKLLKEWSNEQRKLDEQFLKVIKENIKEKGVEGTNTGDLTFLFTCAGQIENPQGEGELLEPLVKQIEPRNVRMMASCFPSLNKNPRALSRGIIKTFKAAKQPERTTELIQELLTEDIADAQPGTFLRAESIVTAFFSEYAEDIACEEMKLFTEQAGKLVKIAGNCSPTKKDDITSLKGSVKIYSEQAVENLSLLATGMMQLISKLKLPEELIKICVRVRQEALGKFSNNEDAARMAVGALIVLRLFNGVIQNFALALGKSDGSGPALVEFGSLMQLAANNIPCKEPALEKVYTIIKKKLDEFLDNISQERDD